jgi:hypothetical protein
MANARNISGFMVVCDESYLYNKQVLVALLVGYHLLVRDFGHCGIMFMNVCVITVGMVMLLRDFWTYRIIFITV